MNVLAEKRIDVATIRQTSQRSENAKGEALSDEEMMVVLPTRHLLAALDEVRLDILSEETVILFPREIAPVLYEYVSADRRLCT